MSIFIDKEFHYYFQRNPIKLVDIGASGGLQNNWRKAKQFLNILAFEPDKREYESLIRKGSSNTSYHNIALYNNETVLDFHLTRKQEVSSSFYPNTAFLSKFPDVERFDVLETIKLNTDTLDNRIKKEAIGNVDFIKLDAQGNTLSILEGASNTLKGVFGLEVEVEFTSIYKKQPLFSDVDVFARRHGFQLFDIKKYFWKRELGKKYGMSKGQIVFADALYLKDSLAFINGLQVCPDNLSRKSKILNAMSISILYGYIDYAVEIFELKKDCFTRKEIELFDLFLKKNIPLSKCIPKFKGRNRFAAIFNLLNKYLRQRDWVECDEHLGNL